LAHTPLCSNAGACFQRAAMWCGYFLFSGDDWGNGRKEGFVHINFLRLTAWGAKAGINTGRSCQGGLV